MAGKGTIRADEINYGYGLTTDGTAHDTFIADLPTLKTDILAGLVEIQQDTFNRWNDQYTGTINGTPSFTLGDRVQIYSSDGLTLRGDATLAVYDDSGAPTAISGVDDNDAKGSVVATDRIWPPGADPLIDTDFIAITAIGQQFSTDGTLINFTIDLAGETLVESTIQFYRNGALQQKVGSVAEAENLGPSSYYYDNTPAAERVQFGPTYPPAQGEELLLRGRLT